MNPDYTYTYVVWNIWILFKIDLLCLTPLSAISWPQVLVVEEVAVPGENHRSMASNW
jgi:hypothetical protein